MIRRTSPLATITHDAAAAGRQAGRRLRQPRRPRKLQAPLGSLHRRHRPAASGFSRRNRFKADCERYPDDPNYHVSHETIYAITIYATAAGELRKDLIRCLRRNRDGRRKTQLGEDRRTACRIWSAFTSAA